MPQDLNPPSAPIPTGEGTQSNAPSTGSVLFTTSTANFLEASEASANQYFNDYAAATEKMKSRGASRKAPAKQTPTPCHVCEKPIKGFGYSPPEEPPRMLCEECRRRNQVLCGCRRHGGSWIFLNRISSFGQLQTKNIKLLPPPPSPEPDIREDLPRWEEYDGAGGPSF